MTRRPRRPPPNAISSQRPVDQEPFDPKYAPDLPERVEAVPGFPPEISAYAVTTYEGRQNLMQDFYYKVPFGGFINAALGLALPQVTGNPVTISTTQFLYPLDTANQFVDIGPNTFADAIPSGAGAIVAEATFPRGSGYSGAGNADRLDTVVSVAGNPGTASWTLEFHVRGTNWDQAAAVQVGILGITDGTTGPNRILIRTAAGSDAFRLLLEDSLSVQLTVDSTLLAVNNTTHFMSVTRRGANVFFHIDGVLQGTINVGAAALFNFNATSLRCFSNESATFGLTGLVSDIRFSNGALYTAANYVPPTTALQSSAIGVNPAAFAMLVPDGYRMILKRVTIAGGFDFSDDELGPVVAMTAAGGPSNDTFATFDSAPILTLYRNSVPLDYVSFGNTTGVNNTNTIGDLMYGPITIDLYQIFNQGDVFTVGQALNPSFASGRGLIALDVTSFCYLWGQIIPSDSRAENETGLSKRPVLTREIPDVKLGA